MSQVEKDLIEVCRGFQLPFCISLEFEVVMYKSDRTFMHLNQEKEDPRMIYGL